MLPSDPDQRDQEAREQDETAPDGDARQCGDPASAAPVGRNHLAADQAADRSAPRWTARSPHRARHPAPAHRPVVPAPPYPASTRSEEHTSELQSLMRISYAVFRLKKKKQKK